MVKYNFKKIAVVPNGTDMIDIVLSKTQRKTPTVVHPGFQISRIRKFYMRKVKYTGENFVEKLTNILNGFPLLDDIHPFYADLINVLYDRDHYKVALGQLNIARKLIEALGRDYTRLLKFGDSLYRCKQLKRAAMGRMCTIMKKQGPSLEYLEQVRQHLSRLPTIDPNTRTLLLTGYPNVGKSSFINKVTRADVEVQPFAFTTKSLFVGHMDYKYLRWQVIDTPGLLDHPLEDRNTIEMQSITALAHLRAAVVFVIDISEQCGYSIQEQVKLFHSVHPLLANKPIIMAMNKIDAKKVEQLDPQDLQLIKDTAAKVGAPLHSMSTYSEQGLAEVKKTACDLLLEKRVEMKLRTRRVDDIKHRLHIAKPVARDNKPRPAYVPDSVLRAQNTNATTMNDDGLSGDRSMSSAAQNARIQQVHRQQQVSEPRPAERTNLVAEQDTNIQQALSDIGVVPPGPPQSTFKDLPEKGTTATTTQVQPGDLYFGPKSTATATTTTTTTTSGKRFTTLTGSIHHYAGNAVPLHETNWVERPFHPDEDHSKFSIDWRKDYDLKNPDWRFDNIPEIYNGENVADYVDPDIDQMLDLLEQEEEQRVADLENAMNSDDDEKYELTPEEKKLLRKIRKKKAIQREMRRVNKTQNHPVMPRKFLKSRRKQHLEKHLDSMGLEGKSVARGRSNFVQTQEEAQRRDRSRGRSRARAAGSSVMLSDDDADDLGLTSAEIKRRRKRSRSRSQSRFTNRGGTGSEAKTVEAEVQRRKSQRIMNRMAKAGEADRRITEKLPKHFYAGKRGRGSTDRR
mmetsp:Transcript_19200/g.28579  ORF Transcript_19200/g.28579 Transcript_19200/m.28579 type:complete len:794 (-) Transcript_19200:38-2419(-)